MKIIKYKDLEWYVIKEDEKERLLFLKDSFTNEMIKKYFTNSNMVNSDCDVRFNREQNPWWRDSYIRQVLNTKFLEDLDINDLNVMETTVELNGEKVTTRDYIRLITKEEVEKLSNDVLKTERYYGYWTMSPYSFNSGYAFVFFVWGASSDPGQLNCNNVDGSNAVRPVISLKSSVLVSEVTDNIASDHDCEVDIEEIDDIDDLDEDKCNEIIRSINSMNKRIKDLESELKGSE